MHRTPASLVPGPFTRAQARRAGVTDRMLAGKRYVAVHAGVYRLRDRPLDLAGRIEAAELALPAGARPTGITRIQQLGLDFGPSAPLRFVREGTLHLAFEGVFLHRTVLMPPLDDAGNVTPAAAFIAYCRQARYIDAVKVGDWLLHHGHMRTDELTSLAARQEWRDGAKEALIVAGALDGEARSLPESELRVVLLAAGVEGAEVNVQIDRSLDVPLIVDLWFWRQRTAVEYEGSQHQEVRGTWANDIERYAVMRQLDVAYVQVTKEKLRSPRRVVGEVYRTLLSRGYDGPPPQFGERWAQAFAPLHSLVRNRRSRRGRRTARRTA